MLNDRLMRLQEIAAAHNGACLSQSYLGARAQHLFRCSLGHEWQARACNVVDGHWCRQCVFDRQRSVPLKKSTREKIGSALRAVDGLEQLRRAASVRGGLCLSTSYSSAHGRYDFICGVGHRWQTLGFKVMYGSWCRICAHEARRLTLSDAQKWASKLGGECLSDQYTCATSKLEWLCSKGHAWSATFSGVRAGHWCPECARAARVGGSNVKDRLKYVAVGRPGRAK